MAVCILDLAQVQAAAKDDTRFRREITSNHPQLVTRCHPPRRPNETIHAEVSFEKVLALHPMYETYLDLEARSPSYEDIKGSLNKQPSNKDFVTDLYIALRRSESPKKPLKETKLSKFRANFAQPLLFSKAGAFIRDAASLSTAALIVLEACEAVPMYVRVVGELLCFFALASELTLKAILDPLLLLKFWNVVGLLGAVSSLLYGTLGFFKCLETPLKIFRLVLLLRVCAIFPSSRNLLVAVWETRGSSMVILSFILVCLVVSAGLGVRLFRDINDYWFGTTSSSLYTSFVIVSQSGWLPAYHDVESERKAAAKLYFLIVSFLGSFIMLNALNGVSAQSTEKVKGYKEAKERMRNKFNKAEQIKLKVTNTIRRRLKTAQARSTNFVTQSIITRLEQDVANAKQFRDILITARDSISERFNKK